MSYNPFVTLSNAALVVFEYLLSHAFGSITYLITPSIMARSLVTFSIFPSRFKFGNTFISLESQLPSLYSLLDLAKHLYALLMLLHTLPNLMYNHHHSSSLFSELPQPDQSTAIKPVRNKLYSMRKEASFPKVRRGREKTIQQ